MKTFTKLAIFMIVFFAFGLTSWGQPLFDENFSYTVGTDLTANGWNITGSTAVPTIAVTASTISYPGYASSGTGAETSLTPSGQDVNHTFTQQTSGTVYASCLVNISAANLTGDYFFHLGATSIGTSFHGRVYAKKDATGAIAFGISKTAAVASAVFSGFTYAMNTTYLIVVKYSIVAGATNDVAALYINPTLNAVEPTSGWLTCTDVTATDLANIGTVALRQGNSSNAPTLKLDGIRIATNWADIVGSAGAVATLVATPSSLSGFTYTQGSGPSASQSYNLSGTDLTGFPSNVVVTGSTNYEVSLNNTAFGASVNVPITGATLASTPIYVRLKAGLLAGNYNNETITNVGGGASTNFTSSGSVAPIAPTITVGTITGFGDQIINTTSSEKSYTVSAINLTDNLTITPPANFEISTGTGASFVATNPITLTPVSGTVASTIIYVRFTPTAVQAYAGNITHVSTGATTQNVAVSGNGVPVPPSLPVFDNFNYTDNSLLTANGWVAHSGAGSSSVAVGASNGLTYAGYSGLSGVTAAIEGNAAKLVASGEDVSSIFAAVPSGPVYFSHLVNVTNATAGYYIHLGASSSNFSARVFVKPSATSGKLNFGISNSSTASFATTPTDFDLNTTYLVIVKYDVSTTGDVSLWVKPSGVPATELAAGTPEHTATASGIINVERICLRQFSATQGITIDGVRVGTSWASILSGGTPAVLTVNGSLTNFGNQPMGSYSAEQSFTVAGTGLTENIVVTPPTGFEISTGTGAGFVATNPINLTPTSGEVAETTIYVRFAPLAVQAYSGNITVATTGATTNNVAVAGTGVAGEPTNNATGFTAGITTTTTIPLSWTDAVGAIVPENYIIKGSSVGFANIVAPVDGTPEANSALVQNVAFGVEAYTFTGLTPNTTYYFKIYPYNGSGSSINYKTGAGTPEVSATTLADNKTLDVTVFLEGIYAGAGMMNKAQDDMGDHFPGNVADQITIELHNALDYTTIAYTASNVDLITNGIASITIPSSYSGSYYVTIKHRNSVETTSAVPVDFAGSTITYNFSTAASQAYGDNMKDMGDGFLALFVGDANQDGLIDGDDLVFMDPDITIGNVGYLSSDLNGDGLVDGDDLVKGDANFIAGVALVTP
jgi:hypothetical protein